MFQKGERVEINKEDAAKYYKMSSDLGNENATFKYAVLLLKGEGVKAVIKQALMYLQMLAENGDEEAINLL